MKFTHTRHHLKLSKQGTLIHVQSGQAHTIAVQSAKYLEVKISIDPEWATHVSDCHKIYFTLHFLRHNHQTKLEMSYHLKTQWVTSVYVLPTDPDFIANLYGIDEVVLHKKGLSEP